MQFGYFDDAAKEYVITRPDTPRPWSNYLGSTEYGAIITNNAGGYSFYKSAAQGRFTRLRFNAVPLDQPGRYLYLRDQESGDYWSASWQPVGKPLSTYQSTCRHGTGYTAIDSLYGGIRTESLYFVPLGQTCECWLVKVTNTGRRARRLRLFTYLEYANNWNLAQDTVNLQYSQFIVKMDVVDHIIDHGTNVMMPVRPEAFEDDGQARHTFLAVGGADVTGFDTDREVFLGPYGTYRNPLAVEEGLCRNSLAAGDNACGTLQVDVELQAGESKEIVVLVGIGAAGVEGKTTLRALGRPELVRAEFERLRSHWHARLAGTTVVTPDAECTSMLNTWSPYNCLITYAWSRAASLVYAGERDGLGYRDTVQDLLGVMQMIPEEAGRRLELMLTGQVSTGGAMPVVKQFAHAPGRERPPAETEYRSDDCLWLFNTVPEYVKETGDLAFFDKVLPYADAGEDTVLGHLRRAIHFSLVHAGAHGLPCGLSADWNDCLVLRQDGESIFVAFQLRFALRTYIEVCGLLGKTDDVLWAEARLQEIDARLRENAWDGEWFLRALRSDGVTIGSRKNAEASIFLNTQSWAVLSGHADGERSAAVMDVVERRLATEYGLMLCDPPVEQTDPTVIKARLFNKGMKENGSIFCHTQGWAIIAETMLGRGDRAYAYFRKYLPAAYNTRAEVRGIEPYVYCQFTHSPKSPRAGASRLPWLSGSASWAYFAATHYILGVRPEYDGLSVDPCIPSAWKEVKVARRFRGNTVDITISNPDGVEKGVRRMVVNGRENHGTCIPAARLTRDSTVLVEMGA
jgi:cellobiose phosphorylase